MSTLVIIPARSGSVGVNRKAMQLADGVPLVLRAVRQAPPGARVVVTTNDPEVTALCVIHGVDVISRPPELCGPEVPLGDVLRHAARRLTTANTDVVVLLQPTVPLLEPSAIADAIVEFRRSGADAAVLVAPDPHLMWREGRPLLPRVNRQLIDDPVMREVGVLICTTRYAVEGGTLGTIELDAPTPDVDTYDDLNLVESSLRRRRVLLRCVADPQLGTGHLFRTVRLAGALRRHHDVGVQVVDHHMPWIDALLRRHDLEAHADWACPDLLVLDALDLVNSQVHAARVNEVPTVQLESEQAIADLTINELLPRQFGDSVLSGPRYAVLREEFARLPARPPADDVLKVLVTFGGSDPSHLAQRVAALPLWTALGVELRVVQGPAARPLEATWPGMTVVEDAHMAAEMMDADLVVTGQGRTQYEAAATGAPTITLAANEREASHVRCPGHLHLGLHAAVSTDALSDAVLRVVNDPDMRQDMSERGRMAVDGLGVERILWRIDGLLRGL